MEIVETTSTNYYVKKIMDGLEVVDSRNKKIKAVIVSGPEDRNIGIAKILDRTQKTG